MRSGQLPSLNAVRAFEASARHLNFRLAAEELGVTQGAVAQHVRGLEDSLGLKLFLRLPRTLALTDQGRAYAGTIRRAFELIVEGTAALRPQPVRLSISVTPTFASKWLLPRLPGFAALHPELSLGIVATDRISGFQPEGIDIAVRYGPAPADPQLEADLLFREELVGVCSPLLLAGAKTPLSAAAGPNSSRRCPGGLTPAETGACISTRPRSPSTPPSAARASRWPAAASSRPTLPPGGSSMRSA